MAKITLKQAVAYIRMSSDKQEDSPTRQREEITKYAAANGYQINKWYADHGLTGTKSKNRPEFQRLMKDAKSGGFAFVLMYEQSRFGREDMLQFAGHLLSLRDASVQLVTCQRGLLKTDDIGGLLMTLVDQHAARSESVSIAHRVASGRRRKLEAGDHLSLVPFAYDRIIKDQAGNTVKRVHSADRYRRPPGHTTVLVPSSDRESVRAVQWAYDAVLRGVSMRAIAVEFNRRGLTGYHGCAKWKQPHIKRILTNPVYCGTAVIGKHRCGQFAHVTDGEPLVIKNNHKPIIGQETFDAVLAIIHSRRKVRGDLEAGAYLLSGLILCGRCGAKVHGNVSNGRGDRDRFYKCPEGSGLSGHAALRSEDLDRSVLATIRDNLLSDENIKATHDALALQGAAPVLSPKASQIEELQQRIDRATERLAGDLLDNEEFAAVSRLRRQWSEELRTLRRAEVATDPAPVLGPALEFLIEARDHLEQADRGMLKDAIRTVVESVIVHRSTDRFALQATASVTFRREVYFGPSVEIGDEQLRGQKVWQAVAAYIREQGRNVTITEVSKHFGIQHSQSCRSLKNGVIAGLIKRNAPRQGWSST